MERKGRVRNKKKKRNKQKNGDSRYCFLRERERERERIFVHYKIFDFLLITFICIVRRFSVFLKLNMLWVLNNIL